MSGHWFDLAGGATTDPVPPNIPIFTSGFAYLLTLLLLAIASGRLLGIRVSLVRRLAAAFVGTIAGIVVFYTQSLQSAVPPDFGATFGIPALLVTMLILVVLELAGPIAPGLPGGLLAFVNPVRAIREQASRTTRYAEVVWIATRNGMGGYARSRVDPRAQRSGAFARSLRRTLEDAGGIFIKLGQVLSTRPDLLPPDMIAELASLQDAVPPVPFAELEPTLTAELGARPSEVFARFDERPLAAASIAQVHRAQLRTGEEVVVKVERPGVRRLVERDTDIIRRLAKGLEARARWARDLRVVELADGFANAVREELDFRIEAGNIEAIGAAAAAETSVRVPQVHPELSTGQILVMEFLVGTRLREAGPILDSLGVDRMAVARQLLLCLLRQVLVDGVFHADPHPGNIMILTDGQPALIDFGSVGRLDAAQQAALRRVLVFLERRDAAQMRDAFVDIADVHDLRRQELLERALSQFMAQRLGPGMPQGSALFRDLLRMLIVDFKLSLPPHVTAVFRALVTLEGTLEFLVPNFKIVDESRKVAGRLLAETMTPASIEQAVRDELVTQLPVLHRLPRRLDQLAASIERGDLRLHLDLFENDAGRRLVLEVAGRATLAFVGAAVGIISTLLLGMAEGPALSNSLTLFHLLGYVGLFTSGVLFLRVIIGVAHDRFE